MVGSQAHELMVTVQATRVCTVLTVSFILAQNDSRIKELIHTGYDGLDFMKG